jgi:hypothetical protein
MILRDIITMVLVYSITIVLGDSITDNNGTVRYTLKTCANLPLTV